MSNLVRDWFSWFKRSFTTPELERLPREEVEDLAREVGVTAKQLLAMDAAGSSSAAQLPKRLQALRIDAEQLPVTDWAALRDMQRVCSVCGTKWQCEQDLRDQPDNARWRDYCPNSETIRGLAKR